MRGLNMRLMVFVALAFLAAGCPFVVCRALAAEFPFTGYIAAREAEVASGPGRRFYTTDKLPRGTQIEVYREDDAGWLAIRPPEGSFSWIPAEHIEPLDNDMGKVRTATDSWIGTTIEDVKEHKSQVALKAGELVEIIDRKKIATSGSEESWLKIAPPAGEFRYVHSRDVSREPVEVERVGVEETESLEPDILTPAISQGERETDEPRQFRSSTSAVALRDIDEVRKRLAAMRKDLSSLAVGNALGGAGEDGQTVQQVQFQSNVAGSNVGSRSSLSPDGFVPRKRRSKRAAWAGARSQPILSRQWFARVHAADARRRTASRTRQTACFCGDDAHRQPRRASFAGASASGAAGDLAQIELDLTLMVAQDKSTWNLAAIRSRVEQLVEHGASPAERGQARLLLDKIKQFEDAFAVADHGPLGPASGMAGEAPTGSPYAPRYDAKGWLKPVVSRSKAAAPYAVVDQDGKPLAFVTPSPGLNIAALRQQRSRPVRQAGLYRRAEDAARRRRAGDRPGAARAVADTVSLPGQRQQPCVWPQPPWRLSRVVPARPDDAGAPFPPRLGGHWPDRRRRGNDCWCAGQSRESLRRSPLLRPGRPR